MTPRPGPIDPERECPLIAVQFVSDAATRAVLAACDAADAEHPPFASDPPALDTTHLRALIARALDTAQEGSYG